MQKELKSILDPSWNNIITAYVGSISHGVYDKETGIDDKDVMNIIVPPDECIIGLSEFGSRETKVIMEGEWDVVTYTIRKFFKLLLKGNPNVLGLLWLRENDYIYLDEVGKMIIKNREIFSSKQVYKSFTGYAWGQFHRMTHYKFEGYMGEKRKALVDKFGYDCKNASHLIRLLKMGSEFMATGELNVFRHDNNMLLDIKRGSWTLDQVKKEAERLFKLAEESYLKSKLPNEPDRNRAEEILVHIQRSRLLGIDLNLIKL